MTDQRELKVAENEALFRTLNEEVQRLKRGFGESPENSFHIVCECGDADCQERFVVLGSDYETVRRDSSTFLVVPGHEIPSTEEVIESTAAYNVVRKRPGTPQRIAQATGSRSAVDRPSV